MLEIVISDNQFIYDALKDIATSQDITQILVKTEQELAAAIEKHQKIDLLIIDAFLPNLDTIIAHSKYIIDFTNITHIRAIFVMQKPIRLQVLLRLVQEKRTSGELFCCIKKDVLYNESASLLCWDNQIIKLTDKENQLMRALLTSKDHTVTKDELLASVWRYNEAAETNTIETHLSRFRAKLPEDILISKAGTIALE